MKRSVAMNNLTDVNPLGIDKSLSKPKVAYSIMTQFNVARGRIDTSTLLVGGASGQCSSLSGVLLERALKMLGEERSRERSVR